MMHHQELVSIPCDKDAPSFTPQEESKPVAYSHVINFPRTNPCGGLGDCGPSCVMCGRIDGRDCTIPNQNKNVCNSCDSLRWYNTSQQLEFKFCKGCKNFICIFDFAEKPFASKCSKCRLRSRTSYFSRRAEKSVASGRPSEGGSQSLFDGSSASKGQKRKLDGNYIESNGGAISLPMPSYSDDDMFALLSTPTLYGAVYPSLKATPPLHPLTASRTLVSDMVDNELTEVLPVRVGNRSNSPILSDRDQAAAIGSRVLSELSDNYLNSDYAKERRQLSSKAVNSSWMLDSANRVSSPDGLVSRAENASLLSSRLSTNFTTTKATHSHVLRTAERYSSPLNIFGFNETPRAHGEVDYHLLGSLTSYINSCDARSPVAEAIRNFEPTEALSACTDTPFVSGKSIQPAQPVASTSAASSLLNQTIGSTSADMHLNTDVGGNRAQKSWENLFEDSAMLDKDLLKSPSGISLPTNIIDSNSGWYSSILFSTKGEKASIPLTLASPVSAAFDGFGVGLDNKKRVRTADSEMSVLLQSSKSVGAVRTAREC